MSFTYFSQDYIKALQILDSYYSANEDPDIPDNICDALESFGLSYDCQGFPGVYDHAISAVRGTLAAVDCLIERQCKVSIV